MGLEKVEIVVSGSSARMLSREVHTSLRGRGIATVIRPFSFREFLRHHPTLALVPCGLQRADPIGCRAFCAEASWQGPPAIPRSPLPCPLLVGVTCTTPAQHAANIRVSPKRYERVVKVAKIAAAD